MNKYRTIDIARIMGVHVNTVRLYEKCGLIPKPVRLSNGYREFYDLHVEQFKLARAAFQVEVLQNGLRKQAVAIIKLSAAGDYEKAGELNSRYLEQIEAEKKNAEEAILITRSILAGINSKSISEERSYTRKEAAKLLHVTMDTLRNWELNGLFSIKRRKNGYRIYTAMDLERLKIIRSLRCANYSLAAILRMLGALSANPDADIRQAIDTPGSEEDIISACDKLLTSLKEAGENARFVAAQIEKMKQMTGQISREG